ncbi:MAG: dUTP diphosphatase [Bacilli bacterium]|nr:dUTP diphosphatase [Bacilli bacterium]
MNLVKWNKLYKNNMRLDKIFVDKYKDDKRLYDKNIVELMVEISEFVNETKVFKYWTTKKPKQEKMLEEYADVITMILTFYSIYKLKIKEYYPNIEETDILKLIMELYQKVYKFYEHNNKEILEEIFYYTIYIGTLLEFTESDVIEAIDKKQKIIEERLNSDY